MPPRLLHVSDIETGSDDPERMGRLAGRIDQRRDRETLVFGTGDNTAPGALSLFTDGRHALDIYRAIAPDAETLGNHDFDNGIAAIRETLRASPQRWLAANVFEDGTRFAADAGIAATHVFERAGVRVGVFGLAHPETPAIAPTAEPLTFTDPFDAAEAALSELRAVGVDHVVVLSHLGSLDDRLAREFDVDVVLGGHRHDERIDRVDGTLLTRPGAGGRTVVEVELGAPPTATRHGLTDAPVDERLAARLRERQADAGFDEVVGRVSEPLTCTKRVFHTECRIGNLVTDALRWAGGTDVGFYNAGGLRPRQPIEETVTVGDIVGVVPFEDDCCTVELSGRALRALVGQAADPPAGDRGWYGHFSGLAARYDRANGAVVSVSVDGDPLDDDATYTVTTTGFIVSPGSPFAAVTAEDRLVDGLGPVYEVVASFLREGAPAVGLDGRIADVDVDGSSVD